MREDAGRRCRGPFPAVPTSRRPGSSPRQWHRRPRLDGRDVVVLEVHGGVPRRDQVLPGHGGAGDVLQAGSEHVPVVRRDPGFGGAAGIPGVELTERVGEPDDRIDGRRARCQRPDLGRRGIEVLIDLRHAQRPECADPRLDDGSRQFRDVAETHDRHGQDRENRDRQHDDGQPARQRDVPDQARKAPPSPAPVACGVGVCRRGGAPLHGATVPGPTSLRIPPRARTASRS